MRGIQRSSSRLVSTFTRNNLTRKPQLHQTSYVAHGAAVIGNVNLGEQSSVWFNSVLRADINSISIGRRTNVQDGAVIHVTRSLPAVLGDNVSVAHNATLHGCIIADNCLIGMGAVVLDNVFIDENSIVGAGAVVTQGKRFPPKSLIIGSPAKRVRELTEEEVQSIADNASRYCQYAQDHRECDDGQE